MSKKQVLSDLRVILRHLRSLPSSGPIKEHVLGQYRANMSSTSATYKESFKLAVAKAHDYAHLISSVREAAYLRSLDTGEKLTQEERVKAMASKVGFEMPEIYNESVYEIFGG